MPEGPSSSQGPSSGTPDTSQWSTGTLDHLCTPTQSTIPEILPSEVQPNNEENSYEDVEDDMNNTSPKMFPKPGLMDIEGNCYVTIVDVSGIHYLASIPCICSSGLDQDAQYLDLGLSSVSYKDVKTVFTFTVLKDLRLSNLECKTTAYQYYQKLQRLTCPSFPRLIPN